MTIAAEICKESALQNNVQKVHHWTREMIVETDFYLQNKEILDQPRGDGYWLFKPYIILDTLNKLPDESILIYSDAGVEFINNINHVIDRMGEDVWLFGNMWEHQHWCKMDVLSNTLWKCDPAATEKVMQSLERKKQVQASVIFIRNTQKARGAISEWLDWCQMPGMIDDSPSKRPNHPEFREHRHDQAILTCLAYRDNIPLHWWPAMYNAGNFTYEKGEYKDDYPVLFHHHRMRNEQFSSADDLDRHMQEYFKRKYKIAA